jgi:hypothetical protein
MGLALGSPGPGCAPQYGARRVRMTWKTGELDGGMVLHWLTDLAAMRGKTHLWSGVGSEAGSDDWPPCVL